MKLRLMIVFAVLGTALAVFPPIPIPDEINTATTEEIEIIPSTEINKDFVDQPLATEDLTPESQSLSTFGRESRSSLIPVYVIKSKTSQGVSKPLPAVMPVKEPVAPEKTRESSDEMKMFGPYAPIIMRQGYGSQQQQYFLPMQGALRPVYNRPYRPDLGFMRPNYYAAKQNYGARANDEYARTYETYGTDYVRDFYDVGYDN